jgi:cold shock protein
VRRVYSPAVQPQGGGKDVFVHISAVEKAGLTNLNEGQSIEYEEVSNRGKTSKPSRKAQTSAGLCGAVGVIRGIDLSERLPIGLPEV